MLVVPFKIKKVVLVIPMMLSLKRSTALWDHLLYLLVYRGKKYDRRCFTLELVPLKGEKIQTMLIKWVSFQNFFFSLVQER